MTIIFLENNLIANQAYYTNSFVSNGICRVTVNPLNFGSIACGIKVGILGVVKPLRLLELGKLTFTIPDSYKDNWVRLELIPSTFLNTLKLEFIEQYEYNFLGVNPETNFTDHTDQLNRIELYINQIPLVDHTNQLTDIQTEVVTQLNIIETKINTLTTLTNELANSTPINTRVLNTLNYTDDLIGLLGTVNTTFTNPHPAKILTTASSVSVGTVAVLTDRINNDFRTSNISSSWVRIDIDPANIGRRVSLTGIAVKSRAGLIEHPNLLFIEGSNDNIKFDTFRAWSVAFTAAYQWQGTWVFDTVTDGNNGMSIPNLTYRYIRIRQATVNSGNTNFLGLTDIALYGTLNIL